MHTLRRQDKDQWGVFSMEAEVGGETNYYSLFHGLSLHSAIKLVNCLNGGECKFEDMGFKTLQACAY